MRWLGMITMATLATIIVPTRAPICIMAPRPLKTKVNAKASTSRNTNSTANSTVSFSPSFDLHSRS